MKRRGKKLSEQESASSYNSLSEMHVSNSYTKNTFIIHFKDIFTFQVIDLPFSILIILFHKLYFVSDRLYSVFTYIPTCNNILVLFTVLVLKLFPHKHLKIF